MRVSSEPPCNRWILQVEIAELFIALDFNLIKIFLRIIAWNREESVSVTNIRNYINHCLLSSGLNVKNSVSPNLENC